MAAFGGVNGTVCNAQQYLQSLLSSDSPSPSISCLTHGDTIGLALATEASFLSGISVIVILIWIGWNVHWYRKTFPNEKWKLFQGPADVYMFSLFVFDLLQAIGGMLDIKWAHNGIVTTGSYCTAQGILQQVGEVGVALIILLLAVHTFVAAVFRVGLRARGVAFGLVCLACVFLMLWVVIGAKIHKNYYTPTPYWCWISPQFPRERLGGDYTWLWIALFTSVMLYVPLYFWAEGFWSVDKDYKFRWWNADQRVGNAQRRAALGMILYPVAYSFIVLPDSVARYMQFYNHPVPSAATFFATSIFHLSGAIDVVLFLIFRPGLLLFSRPEELYEQEIQLTLQGADPQGTASANFSQGRNSNVDLVCAMDEGSMDSATLSHVNTRRIPNDMEIQPI